MPECDDLPDITNALFSLGVDAEKLHLFVQGKDDETVFLGEVDTPTLRSLVANMQKEQKALVDEYTNTKDGLVDFVNNQTSIATKAADKSTDKAQEAIAAAEQAVHAASNIESFANVTHAFHGIKFDEDMSVIWVKGEDGEIFNQKDFLYSAILPTEARFFLEHGQLFVELPFTQ